MFYLFLLIKKHLLIEDLKFVIKKPGNELPGSATLFSPKKQY